MAESTISLASRGYIRWPFPLTNLLNNSALKVLFRETADTSDGRGGTAAGIAGVVVLNAWDPKIVIRTRSVPNPYLHRVARVVPGFRRVLDSLGPGLNTCMVVSSLGSRLTTDGSPSALSMRSITCNLLCPEPQASAQPKCLYLTQGQHSPSPARWECLGRTAPFRNCRGASNDRVLTVIRLFPA